MDSRNAKILAAIAVVVVLALWLIFRNFGPNKFEWYEQYDRQSSKPQPYKTDLLKKMVAQEFGVQPKIIKERIRKELGTALGLDSSIYFFVGNNYQPTDEDADSLARFVEAGGQAFILTKSIPENLMGYLYFGGCEGFSDWPGLRSSPAEKGKLTFVHPSLKNRSYSCYFDENGQKKLTNYEWLGVNEGIFCETYEGTPLVKLGYVETQERKLVNFFKANYGNGSFYFHTTPLVFSNLHLLDYNNFDYVHKAIAHIKPSKKVYWDVASATPDYSDSDMNRRDSRPPQSPLKYIMSQAELKMAWYILLGMGFLFLFFLAKRRQRIIPVLPENTNTSLAYAQTLGEMYFLRSDHRKLAELKSKQLYQFIRERYGMLLSPTPTTAELQRLASKSGVPMGDVQALAQELDYVSTRDTLHDNSLIQFHQTVAAFYKKCK